jgi:hypothetical protein
VTALNCCSYLALAANNCSLSAGDAMQVSVKEAIKNVIGCELKSAKTIEQVCATLSRTNKLITNGSIAHCFYIASMIMLSADTQLLAHAAQR